MGNAPVDDGNPNTLFENHEKGFKLIKKMGDKWLTKQCYYDAEKNSYILAPALWETVTEEKLNKMIDENYMVLDKNACNLKGELWE